MSVQKKKGVKNKMQTVSPKCPYINPEDQKVHVPAKYYNTIKKKLEYIVKHQSDRELTLDSRLLIPQFDKIPTADELDDLGIYDHPYDYINYILFVTMRDENGEFLFTPLYIKDEDSEEGLQDFRYYFEDLFSQSVVIE
jgi:hypothetical protein